MQKMPVQYTAIFHGYKMKIFRCKKVIFFLFFAQNIDCGYRLDSNEYQQSMFGAKVRKIMYTPVNPILSILKWGVRGSSFHGHFSMMKFKVQLSDL